MTAKQLIKAAKAGKCVVGFHSHRSDIRMPAAFVQNMQFVRVMAVLHRLKIYKPRKKNKNKMKWVVTQPMSMAMPYHAEEIRFRKRPQTYSPFSNL